MNKMLHERSKPVIVSTARTNDDNFHVSFDIQLQKIYSTNVVWTCHTFENNFGMKH